jgi:diadenosine tetraphosphatase ApaH/serine/threonine PP2A family protein phosphatase
MISFREFREAVESAVEVLRREEALVRLERRKVLVVGDLHGDHRSLEMALGLLSEYDAVVFLGDYVDRGPEQLEVFVDLLRAKAEHPDKVVTLRGNHETTQMNHHYGFYDVVTRRFGHGAFGLVASLYTELPIAAVLNNSYLLVHGGIPMGPTSLEELMPLRKQGEDLEDDNVIQMLWNDPDESIEWFGPSWRGPGIYRYGRSATQRFLSNSGLKCLVRAHEPVEEGMTEHFGGLAYTVFSCRHYGISPAGLELEGDSKRRVSLT